MVLNYMIKSVDNEGYGAPAIGEKPSHTRKRSLFQKTSFLQLFSNNILGQKARKFSKTNKNKNKKAGAQQKKPQQNVAQQQKKPQQQIGWSNTCRMLMKILRVCSTVSQELLSPRMRTAPQRPTTTTNRILEQVFPLLPHHFLPPASPTRT